jgi:transaldolase
MIKVPATKVCLPVVSKLISEGINVNITLIFSLERYQEVIDAYLTGLESANDNVSKVHSVASFFVSRIDTEIDMRLEQNKSDENKELSGKAAIAQARLAYEIFSNKFNESNPKWINLSQKGANKQRPLWASTSTKNPSYDPLMYITNLIAEDTVNTIPNKTIDTINETDNCITTLGITDDSIKASKELLNQLENNVISLQDVAETLEMQGLKKFQDSFSSLLKALNSKMNQ